MKKTIYVEGMMCAHCEGRVKAALEGVRGVISAKASAKEGAAVVELSEDVGNEALKSAVESQGYKVVNIK